MGLFRDDYMFPTTQRGMREAGMIFESAKNDDVILEDAVSASARAQARAKAMTTVLEWIALGSFSYNSFDEVIVAVCDIDGDFELSVEEEDLYNEVWQEVADALLTLGASVKDTQAFVDGPGEEADDAAARIGKLLSEEMDSFEANDDDIISAFAISEDAVLESAAGDESHLGVLEAAFKKKKVVRDGKVQIVRKRVSGKVRLSAAQKAGLKKARRKANSATAKLARKKSMRIRKSKGL
ncbi:MAG: hypothetical protein IJB53_11845 [Mailhella sp.]|nr:hypothetical protein [Mailhella sp.]